MNRLERNIDLEIRLKKDIDAEVELYCYLYFGYGYPVHIICATFLDDDLQKQWEQLNNLIAVEVQSKVRSSVERYNFYLIIFKENISLKLRAEIEGNRYCCRKIIIPELMPENKEDLLELLKNRLFSFSESSKSKIVACSLKEEILSHGYSEMLWGIIENLKGRISESDNDVQHVIDILQRGNENV